jgi:hypothetical protein
VDPEVEDERTDRFIVPELNLTSLALRLAMAIMLASPVVEPRGWIIGIGDVATGIHMNIDGYFSVVVEIICEGGPTEDIPA